MLPTRTHSYITGLPTTNSQIITFVEKFVKELDAGYIEPETTAICLKAMEELVKALRANPKVRDIIMQAVDKYPEKVFEYQGAKFEKAETGVKYDYSICGSTVWEKLSQELEQISLKLKEQEKFLKALGDNEVPDPETGEILHPPAKTSNSYVKITLKK